MLPIEAGCMPSTSFSGWMAAWMRLDRDVLRHRPLDDDAGDARIGIHAVDSGFQFGGGHVGRVAALLEGDAGKSGLGALVADIDIDGSDIADRDGHELGREALIARRFGLETNLIHDALGDRRALQKPGIICQRHGKPP